MLTLPTWAALLLFQLLILLAATAAILGWLLRRRPSAGSAGRSVPPGPRPGEAAPAASPVRRFLEAELARTRAQQEGNDRALPPEILDRRLDYLQTELDALDYSDDPDRFWAHLCDRIDDALTPGAGAAVEEESVEATRARLQQLIPTLEAHPDAPGIAPQLQAIERRLAALQNDAGHGPRESAG